MCGKVHVVESQGIAPRQGDSNLQKEAKYLEDQVAGFIPKGQWYN